MNISKKRNITVPKHTLANNLISAACSNFFAPQTSSYYESLKLTVQEVGWKRNKEKES
jgi:hypothetical protein